MAYFDTDENGIVFRKCTKPLAGAAHTEKEFKQGWHYNSQTDTFTPPDTSVEDNRKAAWVEANDDYFENGDNADLSSPIQRKISSGRKNSVTDTEWTEILGVFPQ